MWNDVSYAHDRCSFRPQTIRPTQVLTVSARNASRRNVHVSNGVHTGCGCCSRDELRLIELVELYTPSTHCHYPISCRTDNRIHRFAIVVRQEAASALESINRSTYRSIYGRRGRSDQICILQANDSRVHCHHYTLKSLLVCCDVGLHHDKTSTMGYIYGYKYRYFSRDEWKQSNV